MSASTVIRQFSEHFGGKPQVLVRAPGRVNLIGDHTDYNDGFAMPVAIQPATWLALRARRDNRVHARAQDFDQALEWSIGSAPPASHQGWARFIAGVETLLRELGAELAGFDLLVLSTIPIGAGLSSSAALTVGCAKGLAALCGEALTAVELIDLARAAEERFAGVPVGILDQTAILLATAGHALLLDCRSRETRPIPIPTDGPGFLLVDSKLPRTLAGSAYAQRRAECARAVAYFSKTRPEVRSLREVDPEMVRRHASQMEPVAFARALHVTTENRRVLEFAEAIQHRNWTRAGELMDASHASLRDEYEVSTPALERVIQVVRRVPGVLGARVTGAGFGGCVVVLADPWDPSSIDHKLRGEPWTNDVPTVSRVEPSPGASLEAVP